MPKHFEGFTEGDGCPYLNSGTCSQLGRCGADFALVQEFGCAIAGKNNALAYQVNNPSPCTDTAYLATLARARKFLADPSS